MSEPQITIITPTIGEPTIYKLIESIDAQGFPVVHILFWDDKRLDSAALKIKDPHCFDRGNRYSIVVRGHFINGCAYGSSGRAVALMAANTQYVTFADSDVWQEPNHLQNLLDTVKKSQWGFCRRKIWDGKGNYIGIDNFESVGDNKERRVPYLLVDNNTMIFERRFGSSAATLYRETVEYNDDRLMTEFLYKYAGQPGISKEATINQVCPERLESMFRENCTN